MDSIAKSPRKFGGVLMTDQRGADEAVMLIRLAPAQDEQFSLEFYGCLIIGVLHVFKGRSGLLFDIASTPSVADGAGKPLPLLAPERVSESMRSALERVRAHLKLRSSTQAGAAVPPAIVDQLRFFVFEKGEKLVTLDWRVSYAGKTYPLEQPQRPG